MTFSSSPAILAPLADWFRANQRTLPWRALDLELPHPDPYAVLVSELMLQQTQVATVIPYFNRWMARFPDPPSLAEASDAEIHKLWEGLGYYRRARFLKEAATAIAKQGWPRDLAGLMELPGVGPYTAAAVASIAFQIPEPALDGNAFRVLARLLNLADDPRRHAGKLRDWLRPELTAFGPSLITQSLMELGATLCGPRPDCPRCPMASQCKAHQGGTAKQIPPAKVRPAVKVIDLWLLALRAEGHWLLLKPSGNGLLPGLWRWPSFDLNQPELIQAAQEERVPYGLLEGRSWPGWSQVYTHRKEVVTPLAIDLPSLQPAPAGHAWVPDKELPGLALGNRDQKLRKLLSKQGAKTADGMPLNELLKRVMTERT
jgi:A/G-specific adenine glycosylase